MRNGIEAFLQTSSCFEVDDSWDKDFEYYGHASRYVFRTPTPISAKQLRVIGGNGAKLISERCGSSPVHVIGVASRGIPLATAITTELGAALNIEASLSVVGKDGSVEHLACNEDAYAVLVDNAVVSGHTMTKVLEYVQSCGVRVDLVMYLFDREELDETGTEPAARVAEMFKCDVISIFALRDVIDTLDNLDHKQILLEYAQKFCNDSLRNHLELQWRSGGLKP